MVGWIKGRAVFSAELFFFFLIYWILVDLQFCASFRCIAK